MTNARDDLSDLGGVPDNDDLSDLGGVPDEGPPSLLNRIGQAAKLQGNEYLNTVLGAGDALGNAMLMPFNKLYGYHIPKTQSASGAAYNLGDIGGNVAGYTALSELGLPALGLAEEALPGFMRPAFSYLGGAGRLPGAARRVLGMGALGGLENSDTFGGAKEGALMQAGLESLGPIGQGIGAAYRYLRPQEYLNNILNNLGGGQSIINSGRILASSIRNAYNIAKQRGSNLYHDIFGVNNFGSTPVISKPDPLISTGNNISNYQQLGQDAYDSYKSYPELQDAHNTYMANPTLANAHELYKKLNEEITPLQYRRRLGGRYGSTALSDTERPALANFQKLRIAHENDMRNAIMRADPNYNANTGISPLLQRWDAANTNWENTVGEFHRNNTLRQLANGDIRSPRPEEIIRAFEHPRDETNYVNANLSNEDRNRILYAYHNSNSTPTRFLNAHQNLDREGLGSYETPEVAAQANSLGRRHITQAITHGIGGSLLATGAAKALHLPSVLEGASAIGGLLGAHNLFERVLPYLPHPSLNPATQYYRDALSRGLGRLAQYGVAQKTMNQP